MTAEGKALRGACVNGEDVPQRKACAAARPSGGHRMLVINKQRGAERADRGGEGAVQERPAGGNHPRPSIRDFRRHAFLQVNHAAAQLLYACALDMAALTGEETAADLYCGAGTLSLLIAKRAVGCTVSSWSRRRWPTPKRNARRNDIQSAGNFYAPMRPRGQGF